MKSIVGTATLAFGLVAGPAMADEDGRFYAGAGVGQFNLNIQGFDNGSFDDSDTAMQIFGGIRITPHFALEIFYSRYGEPEDTVVANNTDIKAQFDLTGYGPYLVGVLPFGKFEVFAKLGYVFHSTDLRTTTNGVVEFATGDSEDAAYAAGVGMVVLDGLNLRLTYEMLDISAFDTPDVIWLTGAWRF
jgi:OmpA-OmpF porin, OOP family